LHITSDEGLRDLMAKLEGADRVYVDTEFMRERTYFAKLCLVQVAAGDVAATIDPLAVSDLSPFFELMSDRRVLKVFHAGNQDLEILYQASGEVPAPIFDTQVAAALASFPLQVGYGALVRELVGVELDKHDSYTDWSRRPLSERQLEYALNDVRYLSGVYVALRDRLEATGRLEWLAEDFISMTDPATYDVDPEERWRRVKRRGRLNRRQLGVLIEVTAWREREAIRRDVPRGRVVGDDALVQLSARPPRSTEELASVRGVKGKVPGRSAQELFEAVERGRGKSEDELPVLPRRRRVTADIESLTDLMSAIVRTRAKESGIAVPVLASKKQMEALVRGERDGSSLLTGWRRSHIGEELVELLDGRITLSVVDDSVSISTCVED